MKYIFLFLAAFTLLALTEGCGLVKILNDPVGEVSKLLGGDKEVKPKPIKFADIKEMTPEEIKLARKWCKYWSKPTVKEKVRSLLVLGATAGIVLAAVCALILIFVKGAPKKPCGIGICVGLALAVLSILLDEYLPAILTVGAILLGVVVIILVRKHYQQLKKWAGFTKEAIERGNLTHDQVHGAANKELGPAGSKDREAIKSLADLVRVEEA